MKWRSTNVWYPLVLVPLVVLAAVLAVIVAGGAVWSLLVFPALAVLLSAFVLRKSLHFPRPAREYKNLEYKDLGLPGGINVRTAACGELDRHQFLGRVAELLSPMRFHGGAPVVVFSPRMLQEHGEDFIRIAVCREVKRYRQKVQLKTILQLFVPLLLGACAVMAVVLWGGVDISAFARQFAMPFMLTAILVGHFMLWNKCLSLREQKLDSSLAELFPLQDIERYIRMSEELERRNEKEKYQPFSDHYASQRIQRLYQNTPKG